MNNPLTDSILKQLNRHSEGLSEYQLLQELEAHPLIKELDGTGELLLFQKHFLVMNSLYQIQQLCTPGRLLEGRWLVISALHIQLLDRSTVAAQGRALGEADSPELREYYLQWDNLFDMDASGVEQLLRTFWVQYHNGQARSEALQTLQLQVDATDRDISRQYRKLAFQHHPDRGGDAKVFISIRQAYEVLA
ncbi:MAG: DNA-J related domain-containing protein [Motiliproteus sp.]